MRPVKLFYLFIMSAVFLMFHNTSLLGFPTKLNTTVDSFNTESDSISYQQLTKFSAKEIISYLGIPPTNKNKSYLRHLKREIKKTIKRYPQLAQNKVATTLLRKEIEESTLHSDNKKAIKSTLIIVGIILLGVLLLKIVSNAFEKST